MKALTEYIEHFNKLKDLEIINIREYDGNTVVDLVVNDHSIWDNLSDRQFRVLTDKINNKEFNTYKMEFRIVADQDPVGIVLTLVYKKDNEPKEVDEILNNTVKDIQDFLKDLTEVK